LLTTIFSETKELIVKCIFKQSVYHFIGRTDTHIIKNIIFIASDVWSATFLTQERYRNCIVIFRRVPLTIIAVNKQ